MIFLLTAHAHWENFRMHANRMSLKLEISSIFWDFLTEMINCSSSWFHRVFMQLNHKNLLLALRKRMSNNKIIIMSAFYSILKCCSFENLLLLNEILLFQTSEVILHNRIKMYPIEHLIFHDTRIGATSWRESENVSKHISHTFLTKTTTMLFHHPESDPMM